MRRACAVAWVALSLLAAAWLVRLSWILVPALDGAPHHAAEALYLAELDQQRRATPILAAPSIESIASEVHRRSAILALWIGLGLGICLAGALARPWRPLTSVVSGLIYLAGWIQLDAYAHFGLLQGLDLKLRLVQHDRLRLAQFAVVDAFLPLLVTCAVAVALLAALDRD